MRRLDNLHRELQTQTGNGAEAVLKGFLNRGIDHVTIGLMYGYCYYEGCTALWMYTWKLPKHNPVLGLLEPVVEP